MGEKHIRVFRNTAIKLRHSPVQVVFNEHRNAIELEALDGDAVVTQVMHIIGQTLNLGITQAKVVVSSNENLVSIG